MSDNSPIEIFQRISVLPSQLFATLTDAIAYSSEEEHIFRDLARNGSDIKFARVPLDIAHKFSQWQLCETTYIILWPKGGNYAIIMNKEDWFKSDLYRRKSKLQAVEMRTMKYATSARIQRILNICKRLATDMGFDKGWYQSVAEGAYKAYAQDEEEGLKVYFGRLNTIFARLLVHPLYEEPSGDELMEPVPPLPITPTVRTVIIEHTQTTIEETTDKEQTNEQQEQSSLGESESDPSIQ